ncbi:MAG: response regulator transcription factor [Kofleriaceae bacterium]
MDAGKGGKILVIDDEPMVRSAVGRVLSDEGYTVAFAGDGAAALELLVDAPPDVILLDLMMPGMNGRQFLHALRVDLQSTVPVVVMTAVHGLGQRAISLGATDVVEKPFDVEELLNKVALAVFRGRQEATGEIALGAPPLAGAPDDRAVVVVVVDDHLPTLRRLDERLSRLGFSVIAHPRMPDDPRRLWRALAPAVIVVASTALTTAPAALAALVRGTPALAPVPLVLRARTEVANLDADAGVLVMHQPTDDALVRVIELVCAQPLGPPRPEADAVNPAWPTMVEPEHGGRAPAKPG